MSEQPFDQTLDELWAANEGPFDAESSDMPGLHRIIGSARNGSFVCEPFEAHQRLWRAFPDQPVWRQVEPSDG